MAKTIVRNATHEDIAALLDIGAAMHAESPRYSPLSYSRAKVQQLLAHLVNMPTGFLQVAERDGLLIGGMAGIITPQWFSEIDLVASEFALFLLPEHRGGMAAPRLVKSFISWARANGVKPGYVQLIISTGVHVEQTAGLYQALGCRQFSVGFEV